jgi:Kef-type K+ transport system membrane component KefB
MRPLFRSIRWQIALAVLGTAVILAATVYFARGWIPFMRGMNPSQTIACALVLGVTMVAQSPAVVVALRAEMAADGPLTRTVLGVVVVSDLVVVLLFALVSSIAKTLFGAGTDAIQTALSLTWELGGSMLCGVLVGGIVFLYLRYIRAAGSLFVVVAGFIVAEVGQRVDLDPLIVALAAGLFIRNLTSLGPQLLEAVEGAALPVYVIFFAVTGAALHLADLLVIGPAALLFAGVRAGGFVAGSWAAARVAGAPEVVRKFAAFGLIPQAGLALALALLLARTFPSFGNAASSFIVAMVAINQIIAPVLFRMALVKSGESRTASIKPRESAELPQLQ